MVERLQKIIAARCGISRRAAEKLISDRCVTVNGVVAHLGQKAEDGDDIRINGSPIGPKTEKYVYIALNKPVGFVTTMSDEKGRRTVAELVEDVPCRVYPVGRLDLNSEGLLLMTNDGQFANTVMHPSFNKEKTYRVNVIGNVDKAMEIFKRPMYLDGTKLSPPKVALVKYEREYTVLDITIHEGKNRQIRRMCAKAGLTVRRLVRISIGTVKLGRLKSGAWRKLTKEEVESLCTH